MRHTCALAALALLVFATAPQADTFPERPIKVVAPSGPGLLDFVARATADALGSELKASVIVENRAGAGGNLGAEFVARAVPDGYTLLLADSGILTLNDKLYPDLGYNNATAFAPLVLVADAPMILVVPAESPFKSVAQLLEAARASPTKLFYGSAGKGTGGQVAMQLFQRATGTVLTHVPYKGSGEAATAVATGQVDALFNNLPTLRPYLQSGKVRALGVASRERLSQLPDVPTLNEAGVAQFVASAWFGLVAPAGTPVTTQRVIERATLQGLQRPEIQKRMSTAGVSLVAADAKAFAATIHNERQRMDTLAKDGAFKSE
ncbi:MAG: tripartite tricarboxylate transporter substrate binding protein [Proteobacteria bacterium]|nr:tripartite tricarboxylate transporter substrate binding protein [Pseudomonadota bacterium]